ncbi:MAG TPA: carboxypeptidase-like regulatory domain-containing protein, partial [Candidatus Cloacimonadota bacterium]|nr:carboxypeptidase-like regulatory domain-containing protein [Candidatus Cloacimonadota bacterium]
FATLSWLPATEGGDPAAYELYVGTTNPPTTLIVDQAGTSYTFETALEPLTEHFWKVVPKNSSGSAEDCPVWSFTTAESPIVSAFPFFEGFETGNTHNSTNILHWSQAFKTGSTYTQKWTVNSTETSYNRTPRTGDFNATLRYSGQSWMFRPMQLVAGEVYEFAIWARQDATSGANLTVAFGTSANEAAMTNVIINNAAVTNGGYQRFSGVIAPETSGLYFIGILGETTFTPWYLSIDDISVTQPVFVTISGQVNGNDAPTGLADATVKLTGDNVYQVQTTATGAFSIPSVIGEATYAIQVTKEGYEAYNGQIEVDDVNLVIPAITLNKRLDPPSNVVAVASDTAVQLTWDEPGTGVDVWFTHALINEFSDAIGTGS